MSDAETKSRPESNESVEPEWKIAFMQAKQQAEHELQEIHRDAANRARELLRKAS